MNDEGLWLYQKNRVQGEQDRIKEMQNIKKVIESEGLNLIMVKHTVLFYEILSGENIEKKYKKKTEDEEEFQLTGMI